MKLGFTKTKMKLGFRGFLVIFSQNISFLNKILECIGYNYSYLTKLELEQWVSMSGITGPTTTGGPGGPWPFRFFPNYKNKTKKSLLIKKRKKKGELL